MISTVGGEYPSHRCPCPGSSGAFSSNFAAFAFGGSEPMVAIMAHPCLSFESSSGWRLFPFQISSDFSRQ